MDLPDLAILLPYLLCALAGAVVASWVTAQWGRRARRQLQKRLAKRELDLLDARPNREHVEQKEALDRTRESLLKFSMEQYTAAESRIAELEHRCAVDQARYETELARLNQHVVESRHRAIKTTQPAQRGIAERDHRVNSQRKSQPVAPPLYDGGIRADSVIDQATVEARRDARSLQGLPTAN